MWNEPSDEELQRLPRLYQTEKQPWRETVIGMHFFIGGCDWYAAEYDPKDRLFFGFAILNGDIYNAEWGYVSYEELRKVATPQGVEVDRDLYWRTRPAGEVEKIVDALSQSGRL